MKIAFFSDIHANLPALEAVLADIEKREVAMVFCLGDLVGYAPWPNAVIEEIIKRKIPTIAGNNDVDIGYAQDISDPLSLKKRSHASVESKKYTLACIKSENKQYLKNLPRHLRFTLGSGKEKKEIMLVHGSPDRIDEYLTAEVSDEAYHEIFKKNRIDLLFFGHTHKPFYKKLPFKRNNQIFYRHAINTGSVGKPKDGDSRACYAILSYDESSIKNLDNLNISFIRVEYNINRAIKAIKESLLPEELADMLVKGY